MKKNKSIQPEAGNRTGVLIAPELAQELIQGVNQFSPEPNLDTSKAAAMRAPQIKDSSTIGSNPPAPDAGMVALLDKLGSRLAFERSGVRLYDTLIQKREAFNTEASPTAADLRHIRDEELEHMHMLEECIAELGGDPTMVTPAADIGGTMSSGVLKVVADPRTTISQCLEAILAAELIDNDCWGLLINMAKQEGLDETVADFEEALLEEQEHLTNVRKWILASASAAKP
jgi:bacterioferritin (cytochrome b1)